MPLADLQRLVRDAVVNGDSASIGPFLVGGSWPARRFDIHRRHYEESLTAAVVGRFPATGWLIGARRLGVAARAFVHAHPPIAPCIAEYGPAFPGFLSTWQDMARLEYVQAFADLDWHLGRLAVSVDEAPVERHELARTRPDDLADAVVTLQAGLHYAAAPWPIDALIQMYLADSSPDSWTLRDDDVRLEIRGARGEFRFARLSAAVFAFRSSLACGRTLGDAAGHALAIDEAFDPGAALVAALDEGLIRSLRKPRRGEPV